MKLLHWIRKFFIYKVLGLKTHGVRVAIFRSNKKGDFDEVLLVKHRYNDFWVFPGGFVKKSLFSNFLSKYTKLSQNNKQFFSAEKIKESAIREVEEEVLIKLREPIIKISDFYNNTGGKNDTVTLFFCRNWEKITDKESRMIDKFEIAESGWFGIDKIPTNTSQATKNRIAEIIANQNILKNEFGSNGLNGISKIW
ncbi:MAG TPA: NUDIX domain-containing protein [Candidatus Paceibacterota bacterium]|nr:NUDIX domain-containing protein [Candidatus Paceibacterota bacterium]